jgi:hypothetical protein
MGTGRQAVGGVLGTLADLPIGTEDAARDDETPS